MERETRTLTKAQHDRLTFAAQQFPGARVVGWHRNGGPVLVHNGHRRYVNRAGRLVALHAEPA